MSSSASPAVQPDAGKDTLRFWMLVACLVLAGAGAYAGSLRGPFVYLDQAAIRDNPSIRHLLPLSHMLNPALEPGVTVQGRPFVNLSFAVNYALGGLDVTGYHATNVAIHIAAGLVLFGILRRTLARLGFADARLLAWLSALLWVVHPLATEAVTYTVQRAESLMGLLYLLTLYLFIRGSGAARRPLPWLILSCAACLFGMATKEVMVSAPVLVLLFDSIFIAGNLKAAWHRRWPYYAFLAVTWLPLAWLVAGTGGNRGGTSGFGLGVSLWQYLLTQADALVRYLELSVWPHPLIFYYEVHWYRLGEVLPQALGVVALIGLGAWLLWRKPPLGYLVVWFFAILAPTSLVPGLSQTLAEHRMYLAMIPVLVAFVLGVRGLAARARLPAPAYGLPVVGVAIVFGTLTSARNRVYATEVGLWQDTVAKAPRNAFSHNNLGIALMLVQRRAEAIAAFRHAIEIDPSYEGAHDNLGLALSEEGRGSDAVEEFLKAIALAPRLEEPRVNLGVTLMHLQQPHEAARQFTIATELNPRDPTAFNDLAGAEMRLDRVVEAVGHFDRAVSLQPANGEAWFNLGNAHARLGQWGGAASSYRKAASLMPSSADARSNLGAALASMGDYAGAIAAYRQALAVNPNDPDVHENLAQALLKMGKPDESAREHARALALRPNS